MFINIKRAVSKRRNKSTVAEVLHPRDAFRSFFLVLPRFVLTISLPVHRRRWHCKSPPIQERLSRILKELLPSLRIAPKIHYRSDKNSIRSNLIKYSEWEPVSSAASGSRRDRMPRVRKTHDSFDRGIDLIEEGDAQAVLFLFVVKGGFF